MKRNGTAVDAAIATLFCNGVYTSQSMGIGGGFVMTIYIKDTGEVETLNARETAPGAATQNMYHGNEKASEAGKLLSLFTLRNNFMNKDSNAKSYNYKKIKLFLTKSRAHMSYSISIAGPLSIGIPGEIRGYYEAKQKHGNADIPWMSLIQPTIDMCRKGIEVSWSAAEALKGKETLIMQDPGMR